MIEFQIWVGIESKIWGGQFELRIKICVGIGCEKDRMGRPELR